MTEVYKSPETLTALDELYRAAARRIAAQSIAPLVAAAMWAERNAAAARHPERLLRSALRASTALPLIHFNVVCAALAIGAPK